MAKRPDTIGGDNSFYVWNVFVDPASVSPVTYEQIRACLRQNIELMNEELNDLRPPRKYRRERRRFLEITSVVYKPQLFDEFVRRCGYQDVMTYYNRGYVPVTEFQCPARDVKIRFAPSNRVRLVEKRESCVRDQTIGTITDDQKSVRLWSFRGEPLLEDLVPSLRMEDLMAYYRSCRNEQGKNLFDYFVPIRLQEPAQSKQPDGDLDDARAGNSSWSVASVAEYRGASILRMEGGQFSPGGKPLPRGPAEGADRRLGRGVDASVSDMESTGRPRR
ncbi:MAG: hypothetical protein GWN84_25865 [Gammaproteobacteria bacterium]|nr:hypothetical protein [Gammaproteobacteria bacterium]NIR84425.1 hypothetical protein [Gammaproteobacteria bacterium]NIR90906.1 hypothetical protein [Gammaproteobacteria bacterium]NIU07092.1 hypothetical protein [Gammaproteobacteria bacterium]NIV76221.1 hypothetical protein [Gammaproteobacteria bacterium]